MIATLDARRLALEVAGRWRDEEEWGEAVRDMRARVSAAEVRCDETQAFFNLLNTYVKQCFCLFASVRNRRQAPASRPSRADGRRRRTRTRAPRGLLVGGTAPWSHYAGEGHGWGRCREGGVCLSSLLGIIAVLSCSPSALLTVQCPPCLFDDFD